MAKKQSAWIRSKSKTGKKPRTGVRWSGSYELRKGKRIFVLSCPGRDDHEFDSHESAKQLGWVKVA